jgi:hypothetical protein
MIIPEDLQACAEKLYVYDVEQRGWEQEGRGFEVNAHHVLTHLVKESLNKNFSDPDVVSGEIAPDAMQYAIRLGRWSGLETSDLMPYAKGARYIAEHAGLRVGTVPVHWAAHAEAAGKLASNLHDLGHVAIREEAVGNRGGSMIYVARQLITCAEVAAETYGFDPLVAFDDRLAQLRERFGIPQPTE